MKQGIFEEKIFIHTDVKTAIGLISDYSQHTKVHPLIEKVERADNEPEGVRRYFITDGLQWGPFHFKIKYRADILSVSEDTVYTEAHQSPGTYVTNVTKVTPEKDGVLLHETITLKAPDLLFGYALRQARTSHHEMLTRIKDYLESNGES
jgi:hypothetical protein